MKLLIYCFKPYQILDSNPSQKLGHKLAEQLEADCKTVELESCYSKTSKIIKEAENFQPDLILGLGADPKIGKIQVEKIGLNYMHQTVEDECGQKYKNQKIDSEGQTALETSFPVQKLVQHLEKEELSVKTSYHADTFVCNKAYYQTLQYTKQNKNTSTVLLHLPLTPETEEKLERDFPSMPQEKLADQLANFILENKF